MAKKIRQPDTLNDNLLERAVRHQIYILKFGTGLANRIEAQLAHAVPDVAALIARRMTAISQRGFDRGPTTTRRLLALQASLGGLLDDAYKDSYQAIKSELTDLAKAEGAFQVGVVTSEAPIRVNMVMPSTALLSSIVTSRPFDGKLLREWYAQLKDKQKKGVKRALNLGLIEGDDVEAMTRRIIGTRANFYRDGVLDAPRHEARMVVRTAVNHVSTHARQTVFEANQNVIRGIKIVATLDNRTTPICRFQDGRVYPVDGGPRPPFHPNCRTTITVVLKSWRDMGVNAREMPTGARAAMGGEVPADVTYTDFFPRQSRAFQREVLGKTRYVLYRTGKLGSDVNRFSDQHGRLYKLDELFDRERDAFEAAGVSRP